MGSRANQTCRSVTLYYITIYLSVGDVLLCCPISTRSSSNIITLVAKLRFFSFFFSLSFSSLIFHKHRTIYISISHNSLFFFAALSSLFSACLSFYTSDISLFSSNEKSSDGLLLRYFLFFFGYRIRGKSVKCCGGLSIIRERACRYFKLWSLLCLRRLYYILYPSTLLNISQQYCRLQRFTIKIFLQQFFFFSAFYTPFRCVHWCLYIQMINW